MARVAGSPPAPGRLKASQESLAVEEPLGRGQQLRVQRHVAGVAGRGRAPGRSTSVEGDVGHGVFGAPAASSGRLKRSAARAAAELEATEPCPKTLTHKVSARTNSEQLRLVLQRQDLAGQVPPGSGVATGRPPRRCGRPGFPPPPPSAPCAGSGTAPDRRARGCRAGRTTGPGGRATGRRRAPRSRPRAARSAATAGRAGGPATARRGAADDQEHRWSKRAARLNRWNSASSSSELLSWSSRAGRSPSAATGRLRDDRSPRPDLVGPHGAEVGLADPGGPISARARPARLGQGPCSMAHRQGVGGGDHEVFSPERPLAS